ncbi:MAG TPA: diguanylate cyclase [Gallionella sp.]|nr:diguanylate cyclase [Gallionella sp.]
MSKQAANPSELARETLIKLAAHKTPPTPDNYARIYAEISGQPAPQPSGEQAPSQQEGTSTIPWGGLIGELLRQLDTPHKGLTLTRKKEGLNAVLRNKKFASDPTMLFEKINGLMRLWSESPTAPATTELDSNLDAIPGAAQTPVIPTAPSAPANSDMIGQLGELLAQALESLFSALPEAIDEIPGIAQQVRAIKTPEQLAALTKQLRQFWIRVELHANDKSKIHDGLIRLLRLLVENIGEMVEDEEWLHGQVSILQDIIANPIDRRSIADAERGLRDAIIKQSLLKQSLTEAKSTLRILMTNFIDRLGEISSSTGDYHQKIEGYSKKIGQSKNLANLSHLLDDIMRDTRVIQASALRSHEELLNTRKQVQESETKIRQLEQELNQVSELVREDQLTGTLNRRGLDAAFEQDAAQSDRAQSPLCVALLDIDNFKRLNDTKGHQAGDLALVHLTGVIKDTLRPSDSVARYGGEEFIILLPDTELLEAAATIERLQRELTKRYFLNENERILITFSAGVTQRTPQEAQDEVIGRADKAMYQAKQTGKNRVVIAET